MTFKNLSLALCSLFLISCGSEDGGPKAQSTRAEKRGTQAVKAESDPLKSGALKPGDRTWGRIYLDQNYQPGGQQDFQRQVDLLLEPQFKSNEIGIVSGFDDSSPNAEKAETGIAFWGKGLSMTGGLNPNKTDYSFQENLFNTETASLRVSIFWGFNKNPDEIADLTIEEIPIHFNDGIEAGVDSGKLVDSVINGNRIQLIFADAYGKFSLDGIFDANNFEGHVYFKTDAIDQDDQGPVAVERKAQILGKFSVSTCGFFTCAY